MPEDEILWCKRCHVTVSPSPECVCPQCYQPCKSVSIHNALAQMEIAQTAIMAIPDGSLGVSLDWKFHILQAINEVAEAIKLAQ